MQFIWNKGMKKQHHSETGSHLISVLRFILLITICIISSLILVWPLWKFSTSLPKVYTIIVLTILGAALIFLAVKKIIKSKAISVIRFFVNLAIIFATLIFSVRFIIGGNRIIGLIIFAAGIVLEIVTNIIFSKVSHE